MPGVLPRLDYFEYSDRLLAHARTAEISTFAEVEESGRRYPLHEIVVPGERWLVITSGFHGEERSGPLTIAEHLGEIAARARALGVGLRIYPCLNPSGFEAGRRYTASGEKPNNDFLRYEVDPGVWKGELEPGEEFLRYELFGEGPKETRAIRARLEARPAPAAALDIHQDHHLHGQLFYAYTCGDPAAYRPLLDASRAHGTLAARTPVDGVRTTDPDGLIAFHDGSVTDYYFRRGVRHVAALETTTEMPLPASGAINLLWILGFVDLAAG